MEASTTSVTKSPTSRRPANSSWRMAHACWAAENRRLAHTESRSFSCTPRIFAARWWKSRKRKGARFSEDDVLGKPLHTFRDHALKKIAAHGVSASRNQRPKKLWGIGRGVGGFNPRHSGPLSFQG